MKKKLNVLSRNNKYRSKYEPHIGKKQLQKKEK